MVTALGCAAGVGPRDPAQDALRPGWWLGSLSRGNTPSALPLLSGYAAVGITGTVCHRPSRRMKSAKQVDPLRQVDPIGLGNPGFRAVAVWQLRCSCDAPLDKSAAP